MGFRGDDRAVSAVIGAVLVFGFLIILLSIYQAAYIPIQTEQTEFAHSKEVQNDMLELRNAILTAQTAGETTFSSVKLGTRYPIRLLGINPPPAAGSLGTGQPEPIRVTDGDGNSISNLCPAGDPIETRTLQYTPGYSEYHNAPTIVYENTVLYLNFSGRTILLTDQQLVQGDTVNVRPLNTSLYESGVDRVSIESVPGNVNDREIEDARVTYPTGLSEGTWEQLLEGQVDPADVTVTDGELTINASGRVDVACSPTGLNEAPAGGQRQPGGLEINPAGPNDVNYESVSRTGNTVSVVFNNTADRDTSITQARMSFYFNEQQPGGQDAVDPYDIRNATTVFGDDFLITEPMQTLDTQPELPGNNTETTISFEFDQDGTSDNIAQRDFFVIEFRFENGAKGTYFIDVPS
ncbi:hypothetical protein [Halobellus sp. GM3]|uniref:hypothetical protein n=1 Tax=Halobellus sp. GM3 TaxID=3458410 RepID=UPI00403E1449